MIGVKDDTFPVSHHAGFGCLYGTHQEICGIGILRAAARARNTDFLLERIRHGDDSLSPSLV